MLKSAEVISGSGIQFGTSGARGLVEQFTSDVTAAFTHAFIHGMQQEFSFDTVAVAIDNRPSSERMAQACIRALEQAGINAVYYGVVPTPALAYVAMQDDMPSIMVTGSHIPFDRNGLKFYRPDGEITKADEQAIIAANVAFESIDDLPELCVSPRAGKEYIERYTRLFSPDFLKGKQIGIYEHSSAGRDLYGELFTRLGADVLSLERSNEFVPIDTEAVSQADQLKAKGWAEKHHFDMIFSTDGDGDRPLIADENGIWLRGDILGLLCSKALNIEALAVPVSCNTSIEASGLFDFVERTKIGSPYVIAEFATLNARFQRVAGFEANGGYLLGSDVVINGHHLAALPTRDAVLPAIMLLLAASETSIAQLTMSLPSRVTCSDRIQNFATERSQQIIADGINAPATLIAKLGLEPLVASKLDLTDGLRVTLSDNNIIHLRPSGNAPELRCYAEADTAERAKQLVDEVLAHIVDC
ncbi:phosphomannomutase [Vibrio hippocampi]|uniref:Phosphoglucosamine mutase n=1 Tax=Vibrio hippocampi TaxID=654686 RepID=A0ABN8DMR3_9VIBR|nr:phosphomannomutase [Vibrio hippocampi]CAH0527258.1 Phosphoglucosamine mutase [Vibrio hippocampi]